MKKLGFTSLILRNLNQDPLENYFGQIRQTCGSGTDPTYTQFIAGMKTCLVQQVAAGRGTNCAEDDGDILADLEGLIEEASTCTPIVPAHKILVRGARPITDHQSPLSKLTRQAPSFTCSTMCSKLMAATNRCEACTEDLVAADPSSDFLFTSMVSSSVDNPSPSLTNCFLQAQRIVEDRWQQVAWKPNIKENFSAILLEANLLQWVQCNQHKADVKEALLNLILIRIINLKCQKFNSELKAKKARTTRQASQHIPKSVQIAIDHGIQNIDKQDWTLVTGLTGTFSLQKSYEQRISALSSKC